MQLHNKYVAHAHFKRLFCGNAVCHVHFDEILKHLDGFLGVLYNFIITIVTIINTDIFSAMFVKIAIVELYKLK